MSQVLEYFIHCSYLLQQNANRSFDVLIIYTSLDEPFLGSVLPLGKMELNPVAGLVLLSKASTISDDKPSLADLDSDSDEEDDQGTVVVNHVKIVFDHHKHRSKSELYK